MTEYNVVFVVDGGITVDADSEVAALKAAVDALRYLDSMDARSFEVDGCTVRVTARITDDGYEKVDGPLEVVEFAQ